MAESEVEVEVKLQAVAVQKNKGREMKNIDGSTAVSLSNRIIQKSLKFMLPKSERTHVFPIVMKMNRMKRKNKLEYILVIMS